MVSTEHVLKWVKIGVLSLGISGFYSVILVLLRTPGMTDFFSNKDFFKTALVVHVDLSVLVWLLAGSTIIWLKNIYFTIPTILYRVLAVGILCIALAPFVEGDPIMNNYIPMMDNIVFVVGLSLFLTIIFIMSVIAVAHIPRTHGEYTSFIGACIFLIASICLVISYDKLRNEIAYPMDLHGFFERLFWSSGHALQFLYMHTMYAIWIMLLGSNKFPKMRMLIMWINLLAVIPLIPIHFVYEIDSPGFIAFCTDHMKYAGGLSAALIMGIIIAEIMFMERQSEWLLGVNISLFLFAAGGLIGIFISEVNVTIPAHYHGSIVGVSIAVMTMFYHILGITGHEARIAKWQIFIYALGQLMHIGGLAWSGGYGVLRKSPDMILSLNAKISMGIMGTGGLIAIIGGLMFVFICTRKLYEIWYERKLGENSASRT